MKYTEVTAQRESADRFYSIWADPDIREIRKASCCMKTEKKSVSVCAERPHLGPEHGAVQLAGALLVPQLELQRSQSSWGIIAGRGRKQTTSMIHEGKHDYKPRINKHKRSKLLDLIESMQENRETCQACQAIRRWESNSEESARARDSQSSYKKEQTFTGVHVQRGTHARSDNTYDSH